MKKSVVSLLSYLIPLKRRRGLQKRVINKILLKNCASKLWLVKNRVGRQPLEGVYISSKKDRYGSNVIPWINALALSKARQQPLLHNCTQGCYQFRGTLFHDFLIQHSSPTSAKNDNLNKWPGWLYKQTEALVEATKGIPLLEYIESSGIKDTLVNEFEIRAKKKKWKLPFDNNQKTLIIHVRLDDMRFLKTRNNQEFIGEKRLINLMMYLEDKYQGYKQYLMTTPHPEDIRLCENIAESSGVKNAVVISNDDVDLDLYIMMHSNVLILSRSTFGFVSALLHQGEEVFSYEKWRHLDELLGGYDEQIGASKQPLSQKIKILECFD